MIEIIFLIVSISIARQTRFATGEAIGQRTAQTVLMMMATGWWTVLILGAAITQTAQCRRPGPVISIIMAQVTDAIVAAVRSILTVIQVT